METKETHDLEPQQYQRMYWEEDVPLNDVRKSVLRKFVYIGCALCLLFFAAGWLVTFPDQVELPFIIRNNQSEQVYRFSHSVYVTQQYVKPRDKVVKGQYLVRVTSPEIVALIHDYREAEQTIQNFSMRKVLSVEKQKEIIKNKFRQNKIAISEVQKELTVLANKWKSNLASAEHESEVALRRYQIMKKLFDEKAVSKFELLEYETQKNKAADALESARQDYEKARLNLAALQDKYTIDNRSATDELQKTNYDATYDSAYLYNQFELAKNKIENTFGDFEVAAGDLILKANANGVVSYIFDGEKEVAGGSILLKLIHHHLDFYAWVKSPPAKIGRLAIHKKVVLKVASFPFYEWGTLKGRIENLSITPDESGNFSVKISINDYGKLKNLMQPGMTGDAAIILEERTFYYYFFHHLRHVYYKAAK